MPASIWARPGVVCLHGLGGSPHSVAPLSAALQAEGYATLTPLLAGHGTRPRQLALFSWDDWLNDVASAVQLMHDDHQQVVLVGQSMGATLALAAALQYRFVVGVACINATAAPLDPDADEHLNYLIGRGKTMQPVGESDLRDPTAIDVAYDELPLVALLE